MIEFRNVSKAYYLRRNKSRARIVLDDLSFSIDRNEFVCLVGPSGCGKTTVLNMIAGFERPTLGDVLFNGDVIRKPSPERGVIFQDYSLFPWMSAVSNVEIALEAIGVPERDRRPEAMKALKAVNMDKYADMRPNILSGGMKQRVAIARMLSLDPEVMLMDEPFSALDAQTRAVLDREIVELWEARRKTVVFVTHIIEEALSIATRIIMFSDAPGKIVKEWHLAPGDRDLASADMIAMRNDMVETLASCSAESEKINWRR